MRGCQSCAKMRAESAGAASVPEAIAQLRQAAYDVTEAEGIYCSKPPEPSDSSTIFGAPSFQSDSDRESGSKKKTRVAEEAREVAENSVGRYKKLLFPGSEIPSFFYKLCSDETPSNE